MSTAKHKIVDISPHSRIITSEIQKSVFDKSYLVFAMVLLSTMALIGYGVSQIHEMQKDYTDLKEKYELNTLIRLKQVAKDEAKETGKNK